MSEDETRPSRLTQWLYPMSGEVWQPPPGVPVGKVDAIDGRPYSEWRSRYPAAIHRFVVHELVYLAVVFALALGMIAAAVLTLRAAGFLFVPFSGSALRSLADGGLAAGAGMLGGTVFSLKWLYHAVAKGQWHLDRRIWRLSTPFISAGLALAVLALVRAEALRVLNPSFTRSIAGNLGLSFLVGYFSDMTIGKLNELAEVLFAPAKDRNPASRYNEVSGPPSPPPGGGTAAAPGEAPTGSHGS